MKLIVTTFLVYKVKKCLLKSGKVSLLKSRKVRKSQGSSLSEHAQAVGHLCPKRGDTMPKPWGDNAQAVGNLAHCSFLYLVDYIVSYSYCKLTIIFSIPNSTCQSSILFLVSIYILHILFLLSIDIQNPFYKIKRQKKVGMGIKKRRKKEKRNNSYSRRRVCNKEYKGEI